MGAQRNDNMSWVLGMGVLGGSRFKGFTKTCVSRVMSSAVWQDSLRCGKASQTKRTRTKVPRCGSTLKASPNADSIAGVQGSRQDWEEAGDRGHGQS